MPRLTTGAPKFKPGGAGPTKIQRRVPVKEGGAAASNSSSTASTSTSNPKPIAAPSRINSPTSTQTSAHVNPVNRQPSKAPSKGSRPTPSPSPSPSPAPTQRAGPPKVKSTSSIQHPRAPLPTPPATVTSFVNQTNQQDDDDEDDDAAVYARRRPPIIRSTAQSQNPASSTPITIPTQSQRPSLSSDNRSAEVGRTPSARTSPPSDSSKSSRPISVPKPSQSEAAAASETPPDSPSYSSAVSQMLNQERQKQQSEAVPSSSDAQHNVTTTAQPISASSGTRSKAGQLASSPSEPAASLSNQAETRKGGSTSKTKTDVSETPTKATRASRRVLPPVPTFASEYTTPSQAVLSKQDTSKARPHSVSSKQDTPKAGPHSDVEMSEADNQSEQEHGSPSRATRASLAKQQSVTQAETEIEAEEDEAEDQEEEEEEDDLNDDEEEQDQEEEEDDEDDVSLGSKDDQSFVPNDKDAIDDDEQAGQAIKKAPPKQPDKRKNGKTTTSARSKAPLKLSDRQARKKRPPSKASLLKKMGAPSKPPSSYLLFAASHRADNADEHKSKGLNVTEVAKETGQAWKALSEEERRQWDEQAKEQKAVWVKARGDWEKQNPEALKEVQELQNATSRIAESDADDDDDHDSGIENSNRKNSQLAKKQRTKATKRKQREGPLEEDDGEGFSDDQRQSRERQKKKRRIPLPDEPVRPLPAYLLWSAEERIKRNREWKEAKVPAPRILTVLAELWKETSAEEKQKWKNVHQEKLEEWQTVRAEWEEANPGWEDMQGPDKVLQKRGRKSSIRTVSEDEAEYKRWVLEDPSGEALENSKLDPTTATMEELTSLDWRYGRVSSRTFGLERARDEQKANAKVERDRLKKEHLENRGKEISGKKKEQDLEADDLQSAEDEEEEEGDANQASTSASASKKRKRTDQDVGQPEEEISDVESLEDENPIQRPTFTENDQAEDNDPFASDPEDEDAPLAATNIIGRYKDSRTALRTRIENGRVVLDESSMHVRLGDDDPEEAAGGFDTIDEEVTTKFINSATGCKKRKGDRWTQIETDAFYKAVSQWGSDFEMISRLFPKRNRRQIRLKWNREEKANPKLLDAAFNNKMSIDLTEYSETAGVDLSGPPPEIVAKQPPIGDTVKKGENDDGEEESEEEVEEEDEDEDVVEFDDDGNEIVKVKKVKKKKSKGKAKETVKEASATPSAIGDKGNASSDNEAVDQSGIIDEDASDEDELPSANDLLRQHSQDRGRSSSTVATAKDDALSHRRPSSSSAAPESAANRGRSRADSNASASTSHQPREKGRAASVASSVGGSARSQHQRDKEKDRQKREQMRDREKKRREEAERKERELAHRPDHLRNRHNDEEEEEIVDE